MSVTRQSKEATVATLVGELTSCGAFVLADFTGINVEEMTELRRAMRRNGVYFTVVKNTILEKVLRNVELTGDEEIFRCLRGPTALASSRDEVLPARVLKEFAESHEGRPVIKGGFVSGRSFTAGQVAELAEMPGRGELLARVMGSATAPVRGFVSVTGGVIRKLLYALNAVRESKQG